MKRLRCIVCAEPQEVEPSVIQVWCMECSRKLEEESRLHRGRRTELARYERPVKHGPFRVPDSENDWDLGTGKVLRNVHSRDECELPCPFHGNSGHHMAEWPLDYEIIQGGGPRMVRLCKHGIYHPDPDSHSHTKQAREFALDHPGCDACCTPEVTQRKMV